MRKIIIDCDPGVDDALAIMMAYHHPEIKIEAITTVAGNVGVHLTTANALKVLDVLGAEDIPVFPGAASGFVAVGQNAASVHGEDGLGDAGLPPSRRKVEDEPAALALIRLAKANPGELALIAIGPLTNLALALKLEPDLPSYYQQLVIMGGAYLAQGNTSIPTAEFNIFADPEAAAVVFDNWSELTMVSWEATVAHGLSKQEYQALFHFENPRSVFLEKISMKVMNFLENVFGTDIFFSADPLAMAVLLESEIVEESIHKFVQVERNGKLTRGMTVVDWMGHSGSAPNVHIITKVNMDRFHELLKLAVE